MAAGALRGDATIMVDPSSSVLGRSAGFRELIAFRLPEELLDDS
jgi:hypothetical protein